MRGDVLVQLGTDRGRSGSRPAAALKAGDRWLTVTAASRASDRWLVHFEGVDDRHAAEALARIVLAAEPIDDPDELWVHELIGSEVVESTARGRGSVRGGGRQPGRRPARARVRRARAGRRSSCRHADGVVIVIDPPEGLFELDA